MVSAISMILQMMLLFYTNDSVKGINTNIPNSSFVLDSNWPDSTVQHLELHGSAVTLDWKGDVIVLHRGSVQIPPTNKSFELIKEDVIVLLSPKSGKIIASWGANMFAKPHGIEIEGLSVFITDVLLHQVLKFVYDTRTGLWNRIPAIELGERFVPGNDQYHFCRPADVAVLSKSGDFFVADGYCNSRVVQYSSKGSYLNEFRAGIENSLMKSTGIDFNVTHSIAIAEMPSREDSAIIFVADRNNGRIQSFLENGTFLYEIPHERFSKTREMLLSVAFFPAKHVNSLEDEPFGTLFVVMGYLPVGKSAIFEVLVGKNGYHVGHVFPFSPINYLPERENATELIEIPHDIAISEDGNVVYVIESSPKLIVRKYFRNIHSNGLSKEYTEFNSGQGVYASGFVFVYCLILCGSLDLR